jgi:hypothetical protein
MLGLLLAFCTRALGRAGAASKHCDRAFAAARNTSSAKCSLKLPLTRFGLEPCSFFGFCSS